MEKLPKGIYNGGMSREFEAVASDIEEPLEEDSFQDDPQESDQDKINLRSEVFSQMSLLKNLRKHLFKTDGTPKDGTEFKDIRAYLSSSSQLLTMLQKFEEALNTDADFSKVLVAMERAMEDCACPEFVEKLKFYLTTEEEAP